MKRKNPLKYANGGIIGLGEKFVPGNIYDPNPTAGLADATTSGSLTATPRQDFDIYNDTGGGTAPTGPGQHGTPGVGSPSIAGNTIASAFLSATVPGFGLANTISKGLSDFGVLDNFANVVDVGPASWGLNTPLGAMMSKAAMNDLDTESMAQAAAWAETNAPVAVSTPVDMGYVNLGTPLDFAAPIDTGTTAAGPGFGESNTDVNGNYGDQAYGGYAPGNGPTSGQTNADGNTTGGGPNGGGTGPGANGGEDGGASDGAAYALGGMIGGRQNPGAKAPPTLDSLRQVQQGAPSPLSREAIDSQAQQLMSNPAVQQKMQAAVQRAVQSGKLNPESLRVGEQMCVAVLQNPQLYPNLRNFAIQRGLVKPTSLPPQFDQRIVLAILSAIRSASGASAQGVVPPQGVGGEAGGLLYGPGNGTSDSIPARNMKDGGEVKVSTGEYIIPERVVRAKGKDFFDSLIRKYSEVPG